MRYSIDEKQIRCFHHTDDVVMRKHGQRMRTETLNITKQNRATSPSAYSEKPIATTIPSVVWNRYTYSSLEATCTLAPTPPTAWKRYNCARPATPAAAPPIDSLPSWKSRPPSFLARRARLGGDCEAARATSEPSARAECPRGHPR